MAEITTYRDALKELGFQPTFDLKSKEEFNKVMVVWKELTVEARRRNDEGRAAVLSLCKALIQKRHGVRQSKICPGCGQGKSAAALLCQVCSRASHYARKIEHNGTPMHTIETLVPIPDVHTRQSELDKALKLLSIGHIGDSFISDKCASTIAYRARLIGGTVTCRKANPEEKDPDKYLYRVWRVDGLEMSEVNEIIKKRLAGEDIPKPAAWVLPSPTELEELKRIKYKRENKAENAERPPS